MRGHFRWTEKCRVTGKGGRSRVSTSAQLESGLEGLGRAVSGMAAWEVLWRVQRGGP